MVLSVQSITMATFLRLRVCLGRYYSFTTSILFVCISFSFMLFLARSAASWLRRERRSKIEEDPEKLAASIDPGLRLGDYPVLPRCSAQRESPLGWWDNYDRRDKETPVRSFKLNAWDLSLSLSLVA